MPHERLHGSGRAIGRVVATTLALASATQAQSTDPVVDVLGDRYVITKGHSSGFEGIAFDPDTRTLTSGSKVHDLCGELVSDGPGEAPGVAWDPVDGFWWKLDFDKIVVYDGDTVVDTAFVLEEVLDVPGVGPDTLESPRGIALDMTHVYIVDAGPNPGELTSNAWFKFTRDGVPVSSSKATDLVANLDADPDALVDDIVWVPDSSPIAPGRLLVALEHSGIQVIDTDGFHVDEVLWSTLDLPDDILPTAFAGLGIDPLTGDLFLVNNDTGNVQVWTRIPDGEPASFIVGKSYTRAYVFGPGPECNRPLLHDFSSGFGDPVPGTLFGLAYREADGLCYGADFNTGELHAFDPRHGDLFLAGETGVTQVWGLAHDSERDVFYLAQEIPPDIQIYAVDPSDFTATALPSTVGYHVHDLAFRESDASIYAVTCGGGDPRLLRIDRDTGAATVVGSTVCVDGFGYDPGTDRLVGTRTGGAGQDVYAIDPENGDAELVTTVENGAFEGLCVASRPGTTVGVGEPSPVAPPVAAVSAAPNPFRARAVISLGAGELDGDGVTARIYDAAGRAVRTLGTPRTAQGAIEWAWDGTTSEGRRVAAGVYVVVIEARRSRVAAKLVRLE